MPQFIKMEATPYVSLSLWNVSSMIVNVTCTVEERRLLRNPHCLLAGSGSLYLQVEPTIWTLSYPRKHTKCTISLQEWHFPPLLGHIEKQQFYWNWAMLPLQSSSLQWTKFIVDKSNQWLSQRGPTTVRLTYGLFYNNVPTSESLPTKLFRL